MIRSLARTLVRPRGAAFVAAGLGLGGVAAHGSAPSSPHGVPPPSPLWHARGAVSCHCQVPCGIFHDDGRIASILEDAMTIRKAVAQSQTLHKGGTLQEIHQMVRWINTKEDHATKIMTTVAEYFLAQKVKKEMCGSEHEYHEVLALHHAVMVAAMKTKQSSEIGPVDALDKAIQALRPVYEKTK